MNAREPAPAQFSIFGGTERPKVDNPRTVPANGYAARPGTGPQGETCGTCQHCCAKTRNRTYYKCGLCVSNWSASRTSDVLLRSPACQFWAAGTPHETGVTRVRGG